MIDVEEQTNNTDEAYQADAEIASENEAAAHDAVGKGPEKNFSEENSQKKEAENNDPAPKDEQKKDKKQKIKELFKSKQQKIDELTDSYQRLSAEFANYKKRTERDNILFREYSNENLLKNMLAVMDSFEMALKQKDKKEDFVKGMELIYSQLMNVLKQEGVVPFDCVGKSFDPYKHEVLLKAKVEGTESEIIVEELQKGYMYKEKILRHSKVKIAE
ncbi:MAG: nucleotide exchange factor GrpE [Nanoarchaeota archaeon]|nr:nucleotide exchange factor GrpE [Nanoarchaeota archaeon]